MRTRLDLMMPSPEDQVMMKQAQQKDKHDFHARPQEFDIGQHTMVRNMRAGPPWIPGSVQQKISPVTYLVDTGDGRPWKCHIDQMKEFGGTRDGSQPDVTGSQSLNVDVPIPSFDVVPEIAASNTEEQSLDTGDSGGSTNTSRQSGTQACCNKK